MLESESSFFLFLTAISLIPSFEIKLQHHMLIAFLHDIHSHIRVLWTSLYATFVPCFSIFMSINFLPLVIQSFPFAQDDISLPLLHCLQLFFSGVLWMDELWTYYFSEAIQTSTVIYSDRPLLRDFPCLLPGMFSMFLIKWFSDNKINRWIFMWHRFIKNKS